MKRGRELTVSELKQALRFAGIELRSDFVETLYQDPDVALAINEDFIDDLFKRLIAAGVLDPQSISDQRLWKIVKQYLLKQEEV